MIPRPSPRDLFRSAISTTTTPLTEEPVYRSLAVEASTQPNLVGARLLPATKEVVAGPTPVTVASKDEVPPLPMPLRGYTVSRYCKFINDEKPGDIMPRLEEALTQCGCVVDLVSKNELSVVNKEDCVYTKFLITLWDCGNEVPAPPGRFLVELQRVKGCPFLFHNTISAAFETPRGPPGSAPVRRFHCLELPAELKSHSDILPDCLESLLTRCTCEGFAEHKLASLKALASLCKEEPKVRAFLAEKHGKDRIAPLLKDDNGDVREQAALVMQACV